MECRVDAIMHIEADTKDQALRAAEIEATAFDYWGDPEYASYSMRSEAIRLEEIDDSYPILTMENDWLDKHEYLTKYLSFTIRPRVIEGQLEIPF